MPEYIQCLQIKKKNLWSNNQGYREKKQTESNVFSKKNKRKIAALFVQIDDSGKTEENYPSPVRRKEKNRLRMDWEDKWSNLSRKRSFKHASSWKSVSFLFDLRVLISSVIFLLLLCLYMYFWDAGQQM